MYRDIQKASYEQNAARIKADTRILQSIKNAEIVKINFNASAFSDLVKKQNEAQGITAEFTTELNAYSNVKKKLGDTFRDFSNEDLMTYIWLESIEQTRAKDITVGVSKPEVVEDIADN